MGEKTLMKNFFLGCLFSILLIFTVGCLADTRTVKVQGDVEVEEIWSDRYIVVYRLTDSNTKYHSSPNIRYIVRNTDDKSFTHIGISQ